MWYAIRMNHFRDLIETCLEHLQGDLVTGKCPDHGPCAVYADSHLEGEACPICDQRDNVVVQVGGDTDTNMSATTVIRYMEEALR